RKDDEQFVAPDDGARLVDGADAIAVAVPGDAEQRAGLDDAAAEDLEVLRDGRVRVVVGEVSNHLAEEGLRIEAERAQGGEAERAGGAVARVDDEAGRGPMREPARAAHGLDVLGREVFLHALAARGRGRLVRSVLLDELREGLDLRAEERGL